MAGQPAPSAFVVQKDISCHGTVVQCYRNKIFIGTSRKNHCNHKDNAVKSSDKNISVQENWMGGKISDLEKVPIKIGTIIIVRYAIGSRDIPDYYMRRTTYCDNKRKSTS